MATPRPHSVLWEQEDQTLDGGKPTGNLLFFALPEPTYVALSDEAAKRGITVTQLIAHALDSYLKK